MGGLALTSFRRSHDAGELGQRRRFGGMHGGDAPLRLDGYRLAGGNPIDAREDQFHLFDCISVRADARQPFGERIGVAPMRLPHLPFGIPQHGLEFMHFDDCRS